MNAIGVLPFKRTGSSQWTVCFKDATGQVKTGNNIAKTFGNVSDAMVYAKGLVK
jgi:hypothetical protein